MGVAPFWHSPLQEWRYVGRHSKLVERSAERTAYRRVRVFFGQAFEDGEVVGGHGGFWVSELLRPKAKKNPGIEQWEIRSEV